MKGAARGFLLLFIVLACSVVDAKPKCTIEYFTPEQGLSHKVVTGMLKDQQGFMWFCSWDGLNRFDGQQFVTYKSSPGDSSQLGSDRLDMVLEDSRGNLWIEAYDHRVYRFEQATHRFYPLASLIQRRLKQDITFKKLLGKFDGFVWLLSDADGIIAVPENADAASPVCQYSEGASPAFRLPSNNISFLFKDSADHAWMATDKGIACLAKQPSGGFYQVDPQLSGKLPQSVRFHAFAEDAQKVYLGTADGRLVLFDKKTGQVRVEKISGAAVNYLKKSARQNLLFASTGDGSLVTYDLSLNQFESHPLHSGPLYSIYEDSKGRLWLEPLHRGVLLFDPVVGESRFLEAHVKEGLNSGGILFRVLEDRNGNIWVNMKSGGFGYFDEDRQEMAFTVQTSESSPTALPDFVYSILYDRNGILWFTTNERQLIKLVVQDQSIRQQALVPNPGNRWDNDVRGMAYDHNNRLWVGAKSGQLYVYDGENQVKDLFDNLPAGGLGLVYTILPDSRGNVWLGTKENGLFKAVPVSAARDRYHLVHFATGTGRYSLHCNEIYDLLEDGAGRIWIGSFDNGLCLAVDGPTGTRFYDRRNLFANLPSSTKKIRHLALDALGNLWIATTSGLLIMDAGKSNPGVYYTRMYTKQAGNKSSLGNNDVQYLFKDAHKAMWVGTSGGGLSRVSGSAPLLSLHFENYTSLNGMPNDYVLSISQDESRDIWVATENGLSRFDQRTGKFRNYNTYDGFPRASFSESAVASNPLTGDLVFGSNLGIISFDPLQLSNYQFPANIAFTHLEINNRQVGPGMPHDGLPEDINFLDTIELKYNQDILSIDYALLDHRRGLQQPAEYRLLGFDSVWHQDGKRWRATYTNLPPGDYIFQVRAGSPDAYANQPYRQLAISILPPPWKTWWAYILYAIAVITILYFARRNAVTMISLRHRIAMEQHLAKLKANFFTQVSHELRTPLTLIQSPIDQILRKEKLSLEGRSNAELARKNTGRLLRFVNQLLDFRKVESGTSNMHYSMVEVVSFTRSVAAHFREAALSRQLRLTVSSNEHTIDACVDADKLDVVLYNIIGNAVKFTPDGKAIDIIVTKKEAERQVVIAVKDEGKGVAEAELKNIFRLFYESEQEGKNGQKGSGIGLALASEFVQLHKGKIWAENNAAGGLTVQVELKLEQPGVLPDDTGLAGQTTWPAGETDMGTQLLSAYAKPAGAPRRNELVLLVEDNDDLRSFLRQQLGEFYRVETAVNGEAGLKKAIELEPDLVVSDVMMPVMDGITMLDKLRSDTRTSHIPVVLLTAKSSVESQIEGLQYGADFYITKPFNIEHLLVCIENLVRQRRRLFDRLQQPKLKSLKPEVQPVVVTSRDETFLREVISLVEENMTETDFTMESLAESMAMSRSTFAKKFKSLTGLTTVEFVRSTRLQKARQLLDAGYQVAEAAYATGFNNPKYFSTCFREKYGQAPSDYLKSRPVS